MRIALLAASAATLFASTADAGFAGFVAYSRNVGANTVIDVFAAVTNASDKFLNVWNVQSNGVYVQKNTLSTKTWKPDAAGFTSTRSVSDDSFMTAGTFNGSSYGGEFYASTNSNGDPNMLVSNSWSATPASPAATSIPALAGWYTGDPTSIDNTAELMSAWAGSFMRTDSRAGINTSAGAAYGIWCAHLVVSGNNKVIGVDFTFSAFASIKDGVTGTTSRASYQFVPAPGALGLLAVAGIAGARRRRD